MARFDQAKADGHFYIQGKPFPGARPTTWSVVTPQAVRKLLAAGIRIGEDVPFTLLQQLIDANLVRSGGSGHSDFTPEQLPFLGNESGSLPLRVTQDDVSLALQLLLPPLPAEWLKDLRGSNFSALLSRLGVQTPGGTLSAVSLLPIHGGAAIPVRPSTQRYGVRTSGDWPTTWPTARWTDGAKGLDPAGTMFASLEEGGLRLGAYSALARGQDYLYLTHTQASKQAVRKAFESFPGYLSQIGKLDDWEVMQLRMPEDVVESISDWCAGRGHRLASAPWRLTVVAPVPSRHLIDGTPVYDENDSLLVEASPPVTAASLKPVTLHVGDSRLQQDSLLISEVPIGSIYIELQFERADRLQFTLTDATGKLASTRVAVETQAKRGAPPAEQLIQPLVLEIGADELLIASIRAIGNEGIDAPAELELPLSGQLTVQVRLPQCAHSSVSVERGRERQIATGLQADATAQFVAEHLERARSRRQPARIVVDAEAFGSISLVVAATLPVRAEVVESRHSFSAYAKWYAGVGPGLTAKRNRVRRQEAIPTGVQRARVKVEDSAIMSSPNFSFRTRAMFLQSAGKPSDPREEGTADA